MNIKFFKTAAASKKIIALILAVTLLVGVPSTVSAEMLDQSSQLLGSSQKSQQDSAPEIQLGSSSFLTEQLDQSAVLGSSSLPLGYSVVPFGARAFTGDSIAGTIMAPDVTKVVVIPITTQGSYTTFTANEAGLKEALYYLYQENKPNDEYVLYFGTAITVGSAAATHIGRKDAPATPSATDITFTSLSGRIGTLTIVSDNNDPLGSTNTAPTNAKLFTLAADLYLGGNTRFRNVRYNITNLYAQGNDLTLDHGSYETAGIFNVYGGTLNESISGSPTIEIHSTSLGAFNLYGGNSAGGTLTGDVNIVIQNTTGASTTIAGGAQVGTIVGNISTTINGTGGAITSFYGGAQDGTVVGNISTTINGTGGAITSFYGGGVKGAPLSVDGNVTTTINALGGPITNIFGGVDNGDITGSITTTVRGLGQATALTYFYGGSNIGNIGSGVGDVITNSYDTSAYTAGNTRFAGANRVSGTINGNIVNTITAGTTNKGSMNGISGSSGWNTLYTDVAPATLDALPLASRAPYFESTAAFKVYGNITTEVTKGSLGTASADGGARGAGVVGYIQGNTYLTMGTQGLVHAHGRENTDMTYSYTINRGVAGAWDIVGGGGRVGRFNQLYIKGDTNLIMVNVLANYTYGGNFGGYIEGNSSNTMYNGIVHTLEGGGYFGWRTWGNTSATVYNGQVDWFLSGGGWNDQQINGDVNVTVHDGMINASMGASYGAEGTHTVTGNSDVLIKGGDYGGLPYGGNKRFSGGITNLGTLQGNANLTIDLRGKGNAFTLPVGTNIAGGRPFSVNTFLGTTEANTIELSIFTDSGSNVLGGANIYGDGGTTVANTKSGKITMNINSDGSDIGTLYATQYSNLNAGKILRDVIVNVNGANSINAISGGSATDSFTNTVAIGPSLKSVVMNFTSTLPDADIDIGSGGIFNFTSFNVDTILLNASTGSILNGKAATAANHGTSYQHFGDITLKNNGGFGIAGTTALISGGKMTVDGSARLVSPPGTGRVNLTSFATAKSGDMLHWINNGTAATASANGTWFGSQQAYQVLTFTPSAAEAVGVTPFNFDGTNAAGQYYLGDNDTTKASGYGIAIPGSRIDFNVVAGRGNISHDVANVSIDPVSATLPIKAMGSVVKDKLVKSGWVAVPNGSGYPTLTFQPDLPSESWFKRGEITATDGSSQILTERLDAAPVLWSASNTLKYSVGISYSDQGEVSARNSIITEAEAQAIVTEAHIAAYTMATGRPFFTSTITPALIAEINKPLGAGNNHRIHPITYSAGVGASKVETTVNLYIVPNDATISLPRGGALWAQDASMTVLQAQGILDRTQLDNNYTLPVAIDAVSGVVGVPSINVSAVTDINSATAPKVVAVTYSFWNWHTTVDVTILADAPTLIEVPFLKYGSKTINTSGIDFTIIEDAIIKIEDKRPAGKAWSLSLEADDLTTTSGPLYTIPASALVYVNGGMSTPIHNGVTVASGASIAGTPVQTFQWNAGDNSHGVVLKSNGLLLKGNYSGILTWTLGFTP